MTRGGNLGPLHWEHRILSTGQPGKSQDDKFYAMYILLRYWHPVPSVQFSRSVVSDSLWPHESQHTRPPCPSPTSRVCSNSCPWSQWCHPTISSSVIPFSCPRFFPAPGSFPMSRLLASGGQSIGASAPVLPMKIQGWFSLVLTGWISLQSKGSQESSPTPQLKCISSSVLSFLYIAQLSHPYMTTGKTIVLTRWTLVGKVMSAF